MQASLVKFAGFLFNREQGTLSLNDEFIHLEHQQSKILSVLIDNKDRVVTRDQIAEQVWQGIVVEDNTISKAITRLRKVLNDNAKSPQIIKTIPKKGYKFIAEIEPHVEVLSKPVKQEPKFQFPINGLNPKLVIGAVVLLIAAWVLSDAIVQKQPPQLPSSISRPPKPISFREGVELNAHLHADKKRLIFVGDTDQGYGVFTKNVGEATAKALVSLTSRHVYPKWLAIDGYSFVYSDIDAQGQCQIYKVMLETDSRVQSSVSIASCSSDEPVEVFYAGDPVSLFWSDSAGSWQQTLQDSRRKASPRNYSNSKYQMPSPDARRWAYLTDTADGTLITVYDLKRETTLLTKQLPFVISHVKWAKNSDALYHLGEHPANQLFRVTLDGEHQGEQQLMASTSVGVMTSISDVQTENSIEFVISAVDLDVHQMNQGVESKLVNSPFPDYNPAMAKSANQLAFASKRTGSAQIWIQSRAVSPYQLTQFERASYIFDIAWSPDDAKLLVKRNSSLHVIDIETKKDTVLPLNSDTKVAWQWLSPTLLAYVDTTSQSLFTFDTATEDTTLLRTNVSWAQYHKGFWYISDADGNDLYKFDREMVVQETVSTALRKRHWLVNNDRVYLVNINANEPSSLAELMKDGEELLVLSGGFNPMSMKSAPNGALVFHRISRNEANIYQLKLN